MTTINPEHLTAEIAKFRDQRRALQEMVVACFPIGSKVRDKLTGDVGTVHATTHGHPDFLHVRWAHYMNSADVLMLEPFDEPY